MPALNVLQVGRVSGNPSFQFADDSPSEYSSDSDDVNTAAAAVKLLHSSHDYVPRCNVILFLHGIPLNLKNSMRLVNQCIL